jgi:hypothetical protein
MTSPSPPFTCSPPSFALFKVFFEKKIRWSTSSHIITIQFELSLFNCLVCLFFP